MSERPVSNVSPIRRGDPTGELGPKASQEPVNGLETELRAVEVKAVAARIFAREAAELLEAVDVIQFPPNLIVNQNNGRGRLA
jgi:hypothetical protein